MRMTVGSRGMFVGELAMFVSGGCVLLRLFVLAMIVVMGRLMMMMCGGVMVSGRLVVVLTRWMLRCLCHYGVPPRERMDRKFIGTRRERL